jgi:hypothetical protein
MLSVLLSIPQWCDCCQIKKAWVKLGDSLSIPQWCDCCELALLITSENFKPFNPTMVRLLPNQEGVGQIGRQPFNPTMVRLLRISVANHFREFQTFQSHNGAIAAKAKF